MEGGNELEQGKMHNYWKGHSEGQYLETTYHILSIGPSFFFSFTSFVYFIDSLNFPLIKATTEWKTGFFNNLILKELAT